jgi:glucose/arabinose dehydrogenase
MDRRHTVRRLATLTLAAALLGVLLRLHDPALAAHATMRIVAAGTAGRLDEAPDSASGANGFTSRPETTAAAPGDAHIRLALRASGLSQPDFLTSAHDGTSRLFIVEKTGRIKIMKDGRIRSTPFLNIASQVSTGAEQGLLGLAFHPNFETNRKLYVNFTNRHGNTVIREYKVYKSNRNLVNPSTARQVLWIDQPYDNHNGGMLAFGPDGDLYIGMGDGGSGGDPGNRAQNKGSLLGKMLRIGVNHSDPGLAYHIPASNPYVGVTGRNEIWQLGLRNPWRFSFDRSTHDLWIGDVGQASWEEADRATETGSGPGRGINWGWNVLEGTHCYPPGSSCSTAGKTPPLLEYDHGGGRCAITGGYVYRGSEIPVLRGGYVFADYCSGEIWVAAATASAPAAKTRLLDTGLLISSFGETSAGELYVVDLGGRVYRIEQG